jgi:hypothetical protein
MNLMFSLDIELMNLGTAYIFLRNMLCYCCARFPRCNSGLNSKLIMLKVGSFES